MARDNDYISPFMEQVQRDTMKNYGNPDGLTYGNDLKPQAPTQMERTFGEAGQVLHTEKAAKLAQDYGLTVSQVMEMFEIFKGIK